MGVLCEGLGAEAPQAFVNWIVEHLFERKVHLAPGVVLTYVPERFEVHCLGMQIPLDTSESRFAERGLIKPKAVEVAKRTPCYLRLGNIHFELPENEPATRLCDEVLETFTELRELCMHALEQRLGLLKKKETSLQGRPEVMRITNRQQQLICQLSLLQLAGMVKTG